MGTVAAALKEARQWFSERCVGLETDESKAAREVRRWCMSRDAERPVEKSTPHPVPRLGRSRVALWQGQRSRYQARPATAPLPSTTEKLEEATEAGHLDCSVS